MSYMLMAVSCCHVALSTCVTTPRLIRGYFAGKREDVHAHRVVVLDGDQVCDGSPRQGSVHRGIERSNNKQHRVANRNRHYQPKEGPRSCLCDYRHEMLRSYGCCFHRSQSRRQWKRLETQPAEEVRSRVAECLLSVLCMHACLCVSMLLLLRV